jgi:uncharacterized integral membrane protein (TIGR00698 family)
VVATAGFTAAGVIGHGISGIPCAILLGMAASNMAALPRVLEPGLSFSTATVLRAGIVCVGAKLSLVDIATLGPVGVPVVVACIGSGLLFVPWFGTRILGLPPRMCSLIAAGTSICGVTAITAVAPAIKATNQEMSFAIANVVAFP